MHVAALGAFRTACQCTARIIRPSRRHTFLPVFQARSSIGAKYLSTATKLYNRPIPDLIPGRVSRTPMYVRRASVALLGAFVGYGAWYGFNGTRTEDASRASSHTATQRSGDAAPPTRSVLVIGQDELHTGIFVGDEPISKSTGDDGRRVVEMLTPEQATQKMRKQEESYFVHRGQGVVRYDVSQVPSNDPIEDDHAEKIVEIPGKEMQTSDWMFWGVFDGHAGWTTSAKLRQSLISFVARELNETYKETYRASGLIPSLEAVEAAIKRGFTRLDDEIVYQSVQKVLKSNNKIIGAEMLAPALSGSCALLSFYDSHSKLLRVACTGDSRAVLGRRSSSGKWTATPLSVDQTGSNPAEEARMRKLHPGEKDVIRNGRVLGGLEPTRAFGDAHYKWTREIMERLKESFFGRSQSSLLKTPPYVTAEPVVSTTRMEPEKGDFVVMATDGLWEMLTNDEVVGLVGKWMDSQVSSSSSVQSDSVWSKMFGSRGPFSTKSALPVEKGQDGGGTDGQKAPFRLRQWGVYPDEMERFVVKDRNVATHLVRNALGGKNEEQVCALLTLPAPFSRRYRDDLTVQVIFFGSGDTSGSRSGEVLVNREATAELEPVKARL